MKEHQYDGDAMVATLTKLVKAQREPIEVTSLVPGADVPLVADPATGEIRNLEDFLPHPPRKKAKVRLEDQASFINYVKRFGRDCTVIFYRLDPSGGRFIAVIDYHDAEAVTDSKANRMDHVCCLLTEFTEEWRRWTGISGHMMKQQQFAEFIEENRLDIIEPEHAEVFELVKTLNATRNVEFKSALRLDNGDRQLNYVKTTAATAGANGDIEIPKQITLHLPLFLDGTAYPVKAWFRYSIDDGELHLGIELDRPHKVIEQALNVMRGEIEDQLGKTLLRGSGSGC